MKGSYEISVSRRRGTSYKFTVRRNITIIKGNSGTGKTTLFEMVADHMRLGSQSGVNVACDRPCMALTDVNWRGQLDGFRDSVVFVDEGFKDILSHDFADAIKGSSNYFVLITRMDLPSLPYSVNEIYEIKTSGKFHSLAPLYPLGKGYRIKGDAKLPEAGFELLLTEDSKAGLEFYESRFANTGVTCKSAGSNAGVLSWLDAHANRPVFVVADGAAFGAFIDRVLKLQKLRPEDIALCLPESFEWLLLKSGILKSSVVDKILEDPASHIESADYMSWEQFFTAVLRQETAGSEHPYKKEELAAFYTDPGNADKVMALIACKNIR